jgi:hypothetical protein
MTVAPNLYGSMDLSSAFPDVSEVGPGTLLLLVGVLVAIAAGRAVLVLARLVGLLIRSIVQLFRSQVLLVVCLGMIGVWGYHHIQNTDTTVLAPAQTAAPTLGPLATPHK